MPLGLPVALGAPTGPPNIMTDIITRLLSKTIDDAGCMIWQGACCNDHPAFRIGNKTLLVRRYIWAETHGLKIPAGHVVRVTCGTPRCINPDCIKLTTTKAIAQACGALGLMSGPVRSAAIARAKRAGPQCKLTPEAVADIRSSSEPGRVLAERYGVAQAHVSKVQLHKAYRDFSNPFQGLFV